MKDFNRVIVYICVMTIAGIIGIPAYMTGAFDVLFVAFITAVVATFFMIEVDIYEETEEDYED